MSFFVVLMATAFGGPVPIPEPSAAPTKIIIASWYGENFHGRKMANGRKFDAGNPTIVAHKKLPFGTKVLFRNPVTGKEQAAIVQDRGPFVSGRDFDLSEAAADWLEFKEAGLAELEVQIISQP